MSNNHENKIDTFIDLYNFLQKYEENNIMIFLNDISGNEMGYKQESLTKLFGGLYLIDKLKNWIPCAGNFNKKTIKKQEYKDIFYKENGADRFIKGNSGDSSDYTLMSNNDEKHLLIISSKCMNNEKIGSLDIEKMYFHAQKWIGYKITYGFVVKDKDSTDNMINRTKKSSKELANLYFRLDTIIIDWKDINQAYNMFKMCFTNKNISNITNSCKIPLNLKFHQHISVIKTLKMKNNENKKKILWGHIQRSGKSYIIGGCIIQDSLEKELCNYLIITTAPNETFEQILKIFEYLQFEDFNVILLNNKNKKSITRKNIVICSKHFLQTKIDENNEKTKKIEWLKKMDFDMRFLDESHNGGTTPLAQKTLEYYGNNSFTVQITATYSKPINDYNIPRDSWILWDLEDIKLCKNIKDKNNIDRLIEKYGIEIKNIEKYSLDNIISEYSKYPELWILTDELCADIQLIQNYGWSVEACFLLKQAIKENKIILKDEFQNETEMLKIWYRIFGKRNKFGIPDKDFPDDKVFMKRIEKICKNPIIDSRFIGEGTFKNEPMIIMAFLPQNNIDIISKATIKLLVANNVIPNYEIISINSNTTNNPKQTIEDGRILARNNGKYGLLVLSGKQCSLGVSIDNCDIILLLNNITSYDMIYQMMFRCMTEDINKKCGFVIDLNIHRVIETSLINYSMLIKPDKHPKEAIRYIMQERLINLNGDHWMPIFGNNENKITTLCENVYNIYSSNTENALKHFLDRLRFKTILLTKEEQKLFNTLFNNVKPSSQQKKIIEKIMNEEKKDNNKGIEQIKDKKEESKFNYMDILKHIIPLICLLTIHDNETSFVEMFKLIENNNYIHNILLDQIKSWWGEDVNNEIINKFISLYIKYMKNDKETEQIIRTVKELFTKNIRNCKELSILIDTYLVPQELEKKNNAEISTPFCLRKEMLDKIPTTFWQTVKKVFEPCSGKASFIVDIIDRFMSGLQNIIIDEKKRYKTIVEECLYFSDINPTNIFICKLLIDPYNEYKLNYNEGDTLELNIQKKWKIDGFSAVIGNPPYQNTNNNKGSGNTLWNVFVENALTKWLKKDGLLLYVHPRGWRQIKSKIGKLMMSKQIIYLNMNSLDKGLEIFKGATDYDYYLLENKNVYKETIINDYKNNEYKYQINNRLDFIPNHSMDDVFKLIDNVDDNGFINDQSSYEPRKKWMSKLETTEYKYPCVYSINNKNEISKKWSKINDNGHFGIPKFIFSNGNGICKDIEGIYGLTQWAYAIKCNKDNMNNVEKAFNSDKFRNIIDAINLTSNKYNYNIIKQFKNEFWRDFI